MDLRSGKGVQVISAGPEESFVLKEKALKKISRRYDIRDRSVVLISAAGAFRKGKSFLLGFFLRGFSWRGGSERDLTSLVFWSQTFKATLDSGEQVVIFLMDIQGIFDSGSTVRDCAMFALSIMLSSVQIYNFSQNLAENDLQYLQLFADYGRLAQQTSPGPPFQRLQSLVRDWSFPYEHQYGVKGGQELLERRLQLHDGQHSELRLLRNHITSCFQELTCSLMPHPGFKASTDPNFDGKICDISEEFKFCLIHLVPMLLAPENLIVKRIGGYTLKPRDLLLYFQTYINIFNGNILPEPKTIFDQNKITGNVGSQQSLMEVTVGGSKPYLEPKELQEAYHRILDKALHVFRTKKIGGDQIAKTYGAKFVEELEGQYERYRLRNEYKRSPQRLSTTAVLLALAFVSYIVALLAYSLRLESLSTFSKLTALTSLIMLLVWIYVRVTGKMRELGMQLDYMAEYFCIHILRRTE